MSQAKKINRDKTALFFSKSVTEANRQIIKGILGVREIRHYEKYLGLPSLTGKGKRASFNYIQERVWRKLQGWEGKLLSEAGREVLIKAVIQAIPTYPNLALHNDSLLAKQAWCLLQDQGSLFYKIFKPQFFPNCIIMESAESSRGSYA